MRSLGVRGVREVRENDRNLRGSQWAWGRTAYRTYIAKPTAGGEREAGSSAACPSSCSAPFTERLDGHGSSDLFRIQDGVAKIERREGNTGLERGGACVCVISKTHERVGVMRKTVPSQVFICEAVSRTFS